MIDFNQYSVEELSQLNHKLVEHLRLRRQRDSQRNMERFEMGDLVSFTDNDGRIIEGRVIRFNQKTVTIKPLGSECTWRVSPQFLNRVVETQSRERPTTINIESPRLSRNAPCSCGSGKKSKRCCFP